MKRLIVVLLLGGAATWSAVALATPSQGQSSTILSVGAMQADLAFNTGLTAQATGTTWGDKQYSADQLPEFLSRLRAAGVTNLGLWMNLHPLISAKFGMVPIGLLHQPEIVNQQATFAARRRVRLAQPSRLSDLDGRVRHGHSLRRRLLVADVHRRPVVLRDRGATRSSSRTRARRTPRS